MVDAVNPVTNPMGALQSLALNRAQTGTQQYDTEFEALKKAAVNAPEYDSAERWANMAQAAAKVPPVVGGFGALLANVGGAYGQTLTAQNQRNYDRQLQITKLAGDQATFKNLGGIGRTSAGAQGVITRTDPDGNVHIINKADGSVVNTISPSQSPQFVKLVDRFVQEGAERGEFKTMDELHAWATQEAGRIVGGQRQPTQPQMSTPVTSMGQQTASPQSGMDPIVDVPAQDINPWIAKLKQEESLAVSQGDYARAKEVSDARRALEANAPQGGLTLPRRDTSVQKGKEKTAEKSAELYANQFEESVVKPAMAVANTGKIMQDFNNLSQMQGAIKGGKFKEFMAGDTGKWILSVAKPGSDIAKGIANAQEADMLTAGMVNQILMAAKGVQTEGDADRARSQVTQVGKSEDANKYVEAYLGETARQLQMREKMGREHKNTSPRGTYEGFDDAWRQSPIMTQARGSVKKLGNTWVGLTQYAEKFMAKNPGATMADAVGSWNKIGAK
jgi:hypothetical protein